MSDALTGLAARRFAEWRGQAPVGTVFAPGRVNLIGEHLDYNDGCVLPMPIREGTAVAWARRNDGQVRVFAADEGEDDAFPIDTPARLADVGWRSYVRGTAAALAARVPGLAGADLLIAGNLPRGAGLSSSASLCVAIGRALLAASDRATDAVTLARAAQAAEHDHAGVACGIMDQMAVAAGQPGHAMLLDCRSLSFSHHPIPPEWTVLIVDSGIKRALADGEFNRRRAECEAAARMLGVAALRDADPASLEALPAGSMERRRAAHVVSELRRVEAAVAAMAQADLPAMTAILRAGHASLSEDFDVSLPAVDDLVARSGVGVRTFLVGESLMRQADVTAATRQLLGLAA
ncbi:galactokinase [Sandarakinorhabdus rubra]|uniref:galactokinase n=1 Tax=Sandarakinorhabdus rubra TaxID=2672568 RepID=UPI0013D9126D|nr:galactokinase [Sandarakinorhabdus rubra]